MMSYRNYNSLDRYGGNNHGSGGGGRIQDPEFDDFGFDRRRYGSGRYVRNEVDSAAAISIKQDNPDLVQFGNNVNCGTTKRGAGGGGGGGYDNDLYQNSTKNYGSSNQRTYICAHIRVTYLRSIILFT